MPSIFTLQGPSFGFANGAAAPSFGRNSSVLVLGDSPANLGYDFYLQPEFDAADTCPLRINGVSTPVPCDLQPGPRSASSKEIGQWTAAQQLAAAKIGVYINDPTAYARVKSGQLDFKRYRDKDNNLVGKFYNGSVLTIKPITGGWLDGAFKWMHDHLCFLVAGGAGAGTASVSVATKAKAACDALNAMNDSGGGAPPAGVELNTKPGWSTGKKVAVGAGVAAGLGAVGYAISRLLK